MDVMGIGLSRRFYLAGLVSILILLSSPWSVSAYESSVSLYKMYLEADQKAVESESMGDLLAALGNYKSALERLERIGALYPEWFSEIVESRITDCRSNIDRIAGEIERGTEGGMEISPELTTEAMRGKEAVVEGIYSGPVNEICRKADILYREGRYADACREYEKVLNIDPDHPRANFQLGLIYSEHIRDREKMEKFWGRYRAVAHSDMGDISSKDGRYLTAIEEYSEALRAAPDNTSIRRRLADVYFKQMRYPEAMKEYQAALSTEQDDLYCRFRLALMHAELGSVEEAISDLDFIRKRNSDYPGLNKLYAKLKARAGDSESAIAYYRKVVGEEPDDFRPYFDLARLYKEEKCDLENAVEVLAMGLSRFPESTQLAREMGRCCVETGDYLKAREIYESLLEKSPDDTDSIIGIGIISLKEDDRKKAEAYFNKALEIEPSCALALFHLASCYESRGDNEKAIITLEKAVECGIDEVEAYRKIVSRCLAVGETDKAESTLKQAIQRWPGASGMRKVLIALYLMGGKKDAALEELKMYVEQDGWDVSAFLELGNLCYESGQTGDALSAYKEALRLDPGIKGLSKKVAILHQQQGEYAPAIEECLKAIEEEPASPLLHNNLAVCYAKRGMFQNAIEEYEKVLALDSDFAEVHIDLAKIYGQELDDPGKAIEHCCRYLELHPDGEHVSLVKEILMSQREASGK